jgi:hypothetical protein
MKERTKYCPDLRACVLEDRILPAVSDLGPGTLVLTASGYVLVMSPFPVSVADPMGIPGSPGYLTPWAMTGGSSGLLRGSATGVSPVAKTAAAASNGSASNVGNKATVVVGSGANDASSQAIPLVTHNTVANDAVNATPQIGHLSGQRSEVLPPGQVYRAGVSTEVSSQAPDSGTNERPVEPLPIRLRSKPHRVSAGKNPGGR